MFLAMKTAPEIGLNLAGVGLDLCGLRQVPDRLVVLLASEQGQPETAQRLHALRVQLQRLSGLEFGACMIARPQALPGATGIGDIVDELLPDVADGGWVGVDEFRDVGGAVRGGQVVQNHRRRAFPVLVDVGQEELRVRASSACPRRRATCRWARSCARSSSAWCCARSLRGWPPSAGMMYSWLSGWSSMKFSAWQNTIHLPSGENFGK